MPQPLDIKVIIVFILACINPCKSQNRLLMSFRDGEVDYFSLMPFVWRKRCWLTAELLDPTQPGFSADAWLMRSTTGIIIRWGIFGFACVSQAGKTSCVATAMWGFFSFRLVHFYFRETEPRHFVPGAALAALWLVTANGRRNYCGKSLSLGQFWGPEVDLSSPHKVQTISRWLFGSKMWSL